MRQRIPCNKCGFFKGISCICGLTIKPESERRNVYNGVTDDRLYNREYDKGAGRWWSGYAERKAFLDKKGWDCE